MQRAAKPETPGKSGAGIPSRASVGDARGQAVRSLLASYITVFPIITVLLSLTQPYTRDWPLPARTSLLTLVMVPIVNLMVLPRAKRLLGVREAGK